jgi:hypothetical protein
MLVVAGNLLAMQHRQELSENASDCILARQHFDDGFEFSGAQGLA